MGGGNSQERRKFKRALGRELAKESAIPIVEMSKEPISTKPFLHRMLDFIEHPLVTGPVGVLAGLVGFFFFTPLLVLCGCCILLAFHRAKVVSGLSIWRVQLPAYAILLIASVGGLFFLRVKMLQKLKDDHISIPELVSQITSGVVSGVTHFFQSQQPNSGVPDLEWGKEIDISDSFDLQHPGVVLILWVGSIENHSNVSSTTRDWRLEVTLPGNKNPLLTELLRPRGESLEVWSGMRFGEGNAAIFTWNNYLPELTAKSPITKGDPALGFVGFIVRGVPNGRLVIGTKLLLSFDDGMGTTISNGRILDKLLEHKPYIPGVFN